MQLLDSLGHIFSSVIIFINDNELILSIKRGVKMSKENELKPYLMIRPNERGIIYSFRVDGNGEIRNVTLFPIIGKEHTTYDKTGNPTILKMEKRQRVFKPLPKRFRQYALEGIEEEHFDEITEFLNNDSEPESRTVDSGLVKKLDIANPVVRDAFCEGMTAEKLFMHYRLKKHQGYSHP